MDPKLRCIQRDLQMLLQDPDVSAAAIVEVFRETIKAQADIHRSAAAKSSEALRLLNTNPLYGSSTLPSSVYIPLNDTGDVKFTMGEDGLAGGIAEDVLSLW